MSTIPQEQWTRLFENIGGALSGLKRYYEAANLIGGTSYFLFPQRDEFKFFPDPADAFSRVKNLLRGIAYSGTDDVLKIQITHITTTTPHTYNLWIRWEFDGTTLAEVVGGAYGSYVDLTPKVPLGPAGKIKVTAPTGTPGTAQRIEMRVVSSAVRLSTDVTGETEREQLLEAAALESHQITAGNFRTTLLEAARERVVVTRLLRELVGAFLGSDTEEIWVENLQQTEDGIVFAAPTGLLVELDDRMRANTPAQSVKQGIVNATYKFLTRAMTEEGYASVESRQAVSGTLKLYCTRGFEAEVKDPEEFEVSYSFSNYGVRRIAEFKLRPNRNFDWPSGGAKILVRRKTADNDTYGRMSFEVISDVMPSTIPERKYKVRTYRDGSSPPVNPSKFEVIEPSAGTTLYTYTGTVGGAPLPDGDHSLLLTNGARLDFSWANGSGGVGPAGTVEFDVRIYPYAVGDTWLVTLAVTDGRLQRELRRHFGGALTAESYGPTISDAVVAPDLPWVEPYLGA